MWASDPSDLPYRNLLDPVTDINRWSHLLLSISSHRDVFQRSQPAKHRKSAEMARRYPCNWQDCFAILTTRKGLQVHQRSHTGDKPFQCPQCDSSFSDHSALRRHEASKHPKFIDPQFECDLCKMKFKIKAQLAQHITRIHLSSKTKACATCGKTFRSNHELKMHNLTHSENRDFHCVYCRNKYKTKSSLTRHIRETHNRHQRAQRAGIE